MNALPDWTSDGEDAYERKLRDWEVEYEYWLRLGDYDKLDKMLHPWKGRDRSSSDEGSTDRFPFKQRKPFKKTVIGRINHIAEVRLAKTTEGEGP